MNNYRYRVVLTIAGSDSGGGAGIQADIKTISALGCYGTTVITAITAQNTLGVNNIYAIPAEIVGDQMTAVINDIPPSAIKIGMVYLKESAEIIASVLRQHSEIPVIFDPVMVATSGTNLMKSNCLSTFKNLLFPLTTLLTPNLDEAGLITGMKVNNLTDMHTAASRIIDLGCNAVLIKGGHLKGNDLYDVYLDRDGRQRLFKSKVIQSNNTHGTGCTLSSAIASYLALGEDLMLSIEKGKDYVHQAIEHGKNIRIGKGIGPLNHFFNPIK
ncbi:bifunctional hydroxymethylpyrimidine kinase/phosphomethylpyrimidine kinase [Mucilaginibacter sp. L196]|uniref:bifunctional hydroxymethylpyrimidine kinase/phosphomethylpyrimidine kinase n=1 Tax=Mucilaginibacter sp. L196 TaxID=1641870 RepID=UPI00131AD0CC|nr:bifunctional hydroxymethylpyrimidine kinase/phosphomethylpyrimidine kinase [Mucilaginibacter sp. L196]